MLKILVPLIILILIDLYVWSALRVLFNNKFMLYFFWGVTLAGYLFFVLYFLYDLRSAESRFLAIYPGALMFILYISKLFLLPFLMGDDLRRAVEYVVSFFSDRTNVFDTRSNLITGIGLVFFTLPFVALNYGMLINAYKYNVIETEVYFDDLPEGLDGLKIVQLSDIHAGTFVSRKGVQKGIDKINQLEPDIFVFTGDLVNTKADEVEDYIDIFAKIKSEYGKYSVLGNHDYGDYHRWSDEESKKQNFQQLIKNHERIGWDLLINEHRNITVGRDTLTIIGVENFSADKRFPKYGNMEKATRDIPNAAFKVLLSHDPSHWKYEIVPLYKDVSLTLSGHTHGFQFGIEIPGVIQWSPSKYVYKEWAGLYEDDGQKLYVNRGFGVLGYPGRVGILPEITLITLRRK